jgi:hypothetical protein
MGPPSPGSSPPASSPAIDAQSQEFDIMVPDEKIEFPGQNFLRFFYKVKLFPDEILVIDDLPAPDTYQVMVMVIPLPGFQLVTSLAVRHV